MFSRSSLRWSKRFRLETGNHFTGEVSLILALASSFEGYFERTDPLTTLRLIAYQLPLLVSPRHELATAEQNGKALDLRGGPFEATLCFSGGPFHIATSADETKPVVAHWIEVVYGTRFSLKPIESKPDHYNLTLESNPIPQGKKVSEYYRMFVDGGELKIVKGPGYYDNHLGYLLGPLTIESSKLNRTYHYVGLRFRVGTWRAC